MLTQRMERNTQGKGNCNYLEWILVLPANGVVCLFNLMTVHYTHLRTSHGARHGKSAVKNSSGLEGLVSLELS